VAIAVVYRPPAMIAEQYRGNWEAGPPCLRRTGIKAFTCWSSTSTPAQRIDLAIASIQWFVLNKDHMKLLTAKRRDIGVAPHQSTLELGV
jgi:hypothetical protein